MNDFYKRLSPVAAQVADRVGHATYQSAIQRYVQSTPSGWMDVDAFLAELERRTDVPLGDLAPRAVSVPGGAPARTS